MIQKANKDGLTYFLWGVPQKAGKHNSVIFGCSNSSCESVVPEHSGLLFSIFAVVIEAIDNAIFAVVVEAIDNAR